MAPSKGAPRCPPLAWTGATCATFARRDMGTGEPFRYTRDRTVDDLLGLLAALCYYADECRAGCTWTSFVIFGKPGNNPYCHHRALEMQRRACANGWSR